MKIFFHSFFIFVDFECKARKTGSEFLLTDYYLFLKNSTTREISHLIYKASHLFQQGNLYIFVPPERFYILFQRIMNSGINRINKQMFFPKDQISSTYFQTRHFSPVFRSLPIQPFFISYSQFIVLLFRILGQKAIKIFIKLF